METNEYSNIYMYIDYVYYIEIYYSGAPLISYPLTFQSQIMLQFSIHEKISLYQESLLKDVSLTFTPPLFS